jgi:uncharacterized protein
MTLPGNTSQRRTRLFVGVFVAVMALLVGIGLFINFTNPFGLRLASEDQLTAGQNGSAVLEALVIETAAGKKNFRVEIADDAQELSKGLMFRQSMPADQGMLFVHEQEAERLMWMRNTYLSLDMLFIDRTGKIHHIAERTTPFSEDTIPSQGPSLAVLELNGGTVAAHGIKVGDKVAHRAFSPAN